MGLTFVAGERLHYFHPDHLGGLNVVTDNDGRNVQSNTYYPFGETRDAGGSDLFQHKFTGQENDPESGLYYYGARFYDPVIGRFITPDSIVQSPGDPQSLNRYTYCRNNPVLFTDPTGHFINFFFALMIGIGLGAATSAIMGGDISAGAALGGLSAGLFYGAGEIAGAIAQSLTSVTAASMAHTGLHIAAGMGTGALNGAVTHQDIFSSAISAGISAGVAHFLGGYIPRLDDELADFALQLSSHTLIGGVTGGMVAEMGKGDFGQGFAQGAWTAGYGYLFNSAAHKIIKLSAKLWGKVMPGAQNKRPRVKVYGDENCSEYLKTKIFADGDVQSKINLSVPKGAIEAAKSALTVSSFLGFV